MITSCSLICYIFCLFVNFSLAYCGILDLTRENLKNFEIKDEVIQKLSHDFSNKIGWDKDTTTPNNIQKYFDNNCINIDEAVEKLDVNIEFMCVY